MRVFRWEIRRVALEIPYHKPVPMSAQEIIDTALMLLDRFPDDDCVVRNERTGENVWLRPFGRSNDEVVRGIGCVSREPVRDDDTWIQLRTQSGAPGRVSLTTLTKD